MSRTIFWGLAHGKWLGILGRIWRLTSEVLGQPWLGFGSRESSSPRPHRGPGFTPDEASALDRAKALPLMLRDTAVQSSSWMNQMRLSRLIATRHIPAMSATGFDHHAAIHECAMDHAEVAQTFIRCRFGETERVGRLADVDVAE